MNILVVEDEQAIASALRKGLESERFGVAVSSTSKDAIFQLTTSNFDVILLDWVLPGRDRILTAIRNREIFTPVLLLTARASPKDRPLGSKVEANEYLVTQFPFIEVLDRIRALLRRSATKSKLRLVVGDLKVDLITRKVFRSNRRVKLTLRELELLDYLMRREGQVVSRDTIARDVWKEPGQERRLHNVIDVFIAHIRAKVDAGQSCKLIHTVRGKGFMVRNGES